MKANFDYAIDETNNEVISIEEMHKRLKAISAWHKAQEREKRERLTTSFTTYDETIRRFKPTDCGRFGKALEINVKHLLNGNRGNSNRVAAKGKTDVKHKGVKYEIKSNCGEINDNILSNDFIIYSYDSEKDWNNPAACHVIPAKEFVEIVESLGLMRRKVSTNGQLKKSIQSYRNSKRKALAWMTAINNYPTLGELFG